MPFAWDELGQREVPGPASNPRIADYIRRVGHPRHASDETPWCAAFVGACLERAGRAGTGSLMARSYLAWGRPAEVATYGAIAVLSRGRDPALGHVGFVVGMTEEAIFLLGGNQADAVNVSRFERSRLLALRLPAEDPAPTASEPAAPSCAGGFDWSVERILDHEGGWTDDPFDPGGPTNKGITLAVFARSRGETLDAASFARLKQDLRTITDATAARIYRERYWGPAQCEALSPPLAHFHFDTAVNQGVTGAARMLQEALGVEIDGVVGPITLAAATESPVEATLARYVAIRRRHYSSLQHFWRFGRGWLARVERTLSQAHELSRRAADAAPQPSPSPSHSPPPTEEGPSSMPDTPKSDPAATAPVSTGKWWGSSLTIWGALLTAATTVAPAILAALGLDVSPDMIDRLGREAIAAVQAIGGLVGTILAILGRARATAPLERRPLAMRL
jgi:uncharacterized protein (TIGR02594 family)